MISSFVLPSISEVIYLLSVRGIGQKPFFIKGLRIVKGLFRRKPIQTVCFPLQGGEVKQFRRGCGLFLFFKGSTNGLRFLASRFHLPRRRFVVLPFGKGGNAANVQPDDMIFLFLKAADCIVAVYQHSKGGAFALCRHSMFYGRG